MRFLSIQLAIVLTFALSACGGPTHDGETTPVDETVTAPPEQPGELEVPEVPAAEPDLVISDDSCTSDADCVPAGCCHAAACVGATSGTAPACEETMCTMDCQFGTLDCGGSCLCHEGHCAARLSQPPPGLGSSVN